MTSPARVLAAVAERLPERTREALRRWSRSILVLLPSAARLPAVKVELRAWAPCWALRMVAVAWALASAATVVSSPFGWTVAAVLSAGILVRPGGLGAPLLAVLLGFTMLQSTDRGPWSVSGPLLLLGLHACITLGVLLGTTSWAAKVQLVVLGRPALRFAVIQLIAQLMGVAGAALSGRELSWPWVPVVAALASLVLAYVWLPRLVELDESPPSRTRSAVGATARRWGDE